MSPVTLFVLLTGLAAAFVWWLGFRMARKGNRTLEAQAHREHHKAA